MKTKAIRHNFSKDVKMYLACGDNVLHPVLKYVYFKDDFAYASDSHILVKNKISEISNFDDDEIKFLDGMIINYKSFKEILTYDTVKVTENGFDCEKGDVRTLIRFDKGDIKTEKHVKTMENLLQSAMRGDDEPVKMIRLDTGRIKTINEAMFGGNTCKFFFRGEFNATILKPMDDNINSVGLIMPICWG